MKKVIVSIIIVSAIITGAICLSFNNVEKAEHLNVMLYCSCGYADVKFDDGYIRMVKYHHNDVKPGDIIGKYKIFDNHCFVEIYFNGKTYSNTYVMDSLGMLENNGSLYKYRAMNTRSLRSWIERIINIFT